MIKRLRKRFIRIAMISVTAVMTVLSLIVNIANFISVDSELTQLLKVIYQNQGTIPHEPQGFMRGVKPDGNFTKETAYSTRYFVLRFNTKGELATADLDRIASVTSDDTDKYVQIALKHGEGFGYTSGYKYYTVNNGGDRRMAIFLDCHSQMRNVFMIAMLSVIAMAVCILLVYITVLLFSRRAIAPVVKASERQKQFITDASHELKTPITVITTCLKVLEMETGKQKWIDKAQAQNEKLKDLVNSLVTLSRMDEEDTPLKLCKFPISEAVGEAAESFTDFAAEKGHRLNISVTPDIEYCGDEYAVRQLVSILIDNAVKYACEGTPIEFSLEKSRKGVVIRTANECDGVNPEELNRLFDRFYRADKSRTSGGGFGIGLSIARSIAEGHKGSICAKCLDGKTVEFIAELK